MKLKPRDLKKIPDRTLDHYNENAKDFWQGTRDQKVNRNIAPCYKTSRANRLL